MPAVEPRVIDVKAPVLEGEETALAMRQPSTLYGTSDPGEIASKAAAQADTLMQVVRNKGLAKSFGGGKEHLMVEAWTFLGTMFGVFPVCTWTHPLEDGSGWEARVEARTLDGVVVGAAEAMCTRSERNWKGRDEYALRSMAQTRATSKALRQPLAFVAVLAGFEATPAEEMGEPRRQPTRHQSHDSGEWIAGSPPDEGYPKASEGGLDRDRSRYGEGRGDSEGTPSEDIPGPEAPPESPESKESSGEKTAGGAPTTPAPEEVTSSPESTESGAGARATVKQKQRLAILAQELGWDDDERHRQAGVDSFNDLTKEAATALTWAWTDKTKHDHVWKQSLKLAKYAICTVEGCLETRRWTDIEAGQEALA